MKLKNSKGITLIALIITIIVLLILAGVSIATLTGENGLLNKAVTAKETTAQKTAEEQVKLAIMASYNASGKIDLGELKENLNNIEGVTDITEEITDASFPLNISVNGQEVKLNKAGDTITAEANETTTPTTPSESEEPTEIAVTLNKEEITLGKGGQETLQVTITPEDATNKDIICTSSDESVAIVEIGQVASISEVASTMPVTVVAEGTKTIPVTVTAIGYGTTTITVKTTSGEKTASCVVTVESETETQAKAAMPDGASIKTGTTKETGIVMVDSNDNEWVWIEVPETVFTTAASAIDYDAIKADLIAYATDYRGSYSDTYYSECGISSSTEYTTMYNKMLSSIYTNKGFYISRYEIGDKESTASNITRTSSTGVINTPVSKVDQIPYNYVTCSQAQTLASSMATGGKTSSLMFGLQWDLVCKYLEESGTAKADINSDSTSWGNYSDSSLTLKSGKYNTKPGSSTSLWTAFNTDTTNYVTSSQTSSNTSYYQLLTTGASEQTNKMNIYDFAGNECEWTLEKTTSSITPCVVRGGRYNLTGSGFPASGRYTSGTTSNSDLIGFRSALY